MKRRQFLQSTALVTAAVTSVSAGASPESEAFPLLMVDRDVAAVTGGVKVVLAKGEALSPAHLRLLQQDGFYAVLSPANAVILDELMRFEHGVTVENVSAGAANVLQTCGQDAQLVRVAGFIGCSVG